MPVKSFHCIAVDMGAGSIRIMLGSLSGTKLSYTEIHRFQNEIQQIEGQDCWNLEGIRKEIARGIGIALEKEPGVSSIGVDSWGVDYVLTDGEGRVLGLPVAYRDRRTTGMRERWAESMSEEETFGRTGINFYAFNTLFQLLAQKDDALLSSSQHLLFLPSYFSFLLSGNPVNELTIASTSQLLAAGSVDWDGEILDKLGLDSRKLGKPVLPGTRLGKMTWPLQRTGIETIAVCQHDTASVVASLPLGKKGTAYISAGTWCVVGIESGSPLLDPEALLLGFTNERGYGNSYRVLKNVVGLWLMQELRNEFSEDIDYAQMEELAVGAEGALHFIDPDDPLFYNPASMREAFMEFFNKSGQEPPEHMGGFLRSAYESLGFSLRFYLDKLEMLGGIALEEVCLVGGGSQSELFRQLIAKISRRKVLTGPVEGATLGNIAVQAIAMQHLKDLEEAREIIRHSFPGKLSEPGAPDAELEKRYAAYLAYKNKHKLY